MFSRQGLKQTWKDIRPYFVFSVILFFAGFIVGGSPNSPVEWMSKQLQEMAQMSQIAQKSDNPEYAMFTMILGRNLYASFMAMGFGLIAGIFPVIVLVMNGMIIGYLLSGIADQGINVWPLVFKGLLPHGVPELAAVFLACAFGIRFGITLIRSIGRAAIGKEEAWQPFKRTAIGSVPAIVAITALLLVAAVVESTVSYWLMS